VCIAFLCFVHWTWLTAQARGAQEHKVAVIVGCIFVFSGIGALVGVVLTHSRISPTENVQSSGEKPTQPISKPVVTEAVKDYDTDTALPEAGQNWNKDGIVFGPPEVPPQGFVEDPLDKKQSKLRSMPRVELADKVTEITTKMRNYDRSWMTSGLELPAPDPPPTTTGEGEDYKKEMEFYNGRMKEWQAEKDRRLEKFRGLFQQQFAKELLILDELANRFQEVRASSECQPVFSGTFYHGQLSGCADYLDKIVREKLD
jgi:hypothetical protein